MDKDLKSSQKQSKKSSLGKKLRNFTVKLIKSVFKLVKTVLKFIVVASVKIYKENKKDQREYKEKKQRKSITKQNKLTNVLLNKLLFEKSNDLKRKKRVDKLNNQNDDLPLSEQRASHRTSTVDLTKMTEVQGRKATTLNPLNGSRSKEDGVIRNVQLVPRLRPR